MGNELMGMVDCVLVGWVERSVAGGKSWLVVEVV